MVLLIFELAIILIGCKIFGDISVRFGQPSVLGKLLVGIVLGPAVFGILSSSATLEELSQIGVILLMFIAGLETDVEEFKRSGKGVLFVGLNGILVPFAGGFIAGIIIIGLEAFQSLFLAFGIGAAMISRGEVALIIAAIGLESKLVSEELFAALVVVVLVTTLVTPPLMKWIFKHQLKQEELISQNVQKEVEIN